MEQRAMVLISNISVLNNFALLTACYFFSLDIDECVASNPCDKNADCVNTNSSFICTCRLGFTGNGRTCTGTYFHTFCFLFSCFF